MSSSARTVLLILVVLCLGLGVGWAVGRRNTGPQPPTPRTPAEVERDQALSGELRGLLLERDTLTRVALLSAKLSELGPEDLGSVVELLESHALGLGQVEAALLVRFWVSYDPQGAAEWSTSSRVDVAIRLAVLCAVIETWASFDPEGPRQLVEEYLSFPSDLVPPTVLGAYVRGWYASGQPGVLGFLRTLEPSKARSRALTTFARQSLGDVGFDATAQLLLDYPPDDYRFRTQLWRYAAPEMLREDRAKTLAFCSAYCDRFGSSFVRQRLAREWMRQPDVVPAEVMEWLSNAKAGQERDFAVQQAVEIWAIDDQEGLADWGFELAQDEVEPWLYPGLAVIGSAVALQDPAVGIRLANQIRPEEQRHSALVRIGVGFIRNDPEAAEIWLESARLPPAAKDRIRQGAAGPDEPTQQTVEPTPSRTVKPGLRVVRPTSS
ncbi:MAG: hypothetical protein P8M78_03040 [Myxococcota bacterium]|nr:hypothetical protein [Myxococcota bacterium]